jgi:hypothetical protein
MKQLTSLSLGRIAIVSSLVGLAGLVGALIVQGQESPTPDLAPLGILPQDATRIPDPEKRQVWERELSIELTARASSRAPKDPLYTPPPETPVPEPTGIYWLANPDGPVFWTNHWHGPYGGGRIAVYAGRNSRTGEGVLKIEGLGAGTARHYTSPADGGLEIASVEGDLVQLTSQSGRVFTFDLASGILLADGTPVPSVTPISSTVEPDASATPALP